MPGAERIGPKKQRRLFLKEWRKHYGLTQKQLAERLGVTEATISRWESPKTKFKARPNDQVLAALAEALHPDMEPEDFYHHPDKPTPNQLLRGQPKEVQEQALRWLQAVVGRKAS